MCQEFMPILRDGGRIVNVSSQSGLLKYYKPGIAKRFRAPYITLEDVEQLVQEYNVCCFDIPT
jgi:carbonyl reductase 1